MHFFDKPDVTLIGVTRGLVALGPEDFPYFGALGCREQGSVLELAQREVGSPERRKKERSRLFRASAGCGHGSVEDQGVFTFCLENVPRIVTLHICQPQYGAHLQQSMRNATAERGYHFPREFIDEPVIGEVISDAFELYARMMKGGVKAEDARYVLPLGVRTNIMTQWDARALKELHSMSRGEHMPSVIQETVEKMIELARCIAPSLMQESPGSYEPLGWFPSAQLFGEQSLGLENLLRNYDVEDYGAKVIDECRDLPLPLSVTLNRGIGLRNEAELALLKHFHFTGLARMSLAAFHQCIRQRTWDQAVEQIYGAIERGDFTIPPGVSKEGFGQEYLAQSKRMLAVYNDLISSDSGTRYPAQECLGLIPHGLQVFDLLHINGWNATCGGLGVRMCSKAQWEIRKVAQDVGEGIKNVSFALAPYIGPRCQTWGRCLESNPCKPEYKK